MRSWLNDDFYNIAFSSSEKSQLKTNNIVNPDNPWYGTSGGNNTDDKLFLLSYEDTVNTAYGFSRWYSTYDAKRQAQGTGFSKSNGLSVFVGSEKGFVGNSSWWLRSPGGILVYAGIVGTGGKLNEYSSDVTYTAEGVRPAFKSNLSSEILVSSSSVAEKLVALVVILVADCAMLSFIIYKRKRNRNSVENKSDMKNS
jgi:hypothetical protein